MLQNDQEKPLKTFTLYTKSYKAAYITSFPVISEYLIINIRAVLAAQDREANIPVYSWADTDLCALKKMQLLPGMPGQTLCCSGVCGSGSVTLFPGWVPTGSQPLFSWGSQMLGQESRAQGMLPHWAALPWWAGERATGACWLCSVPAAASEKHLIAAEFVITGMELQRTFPADFSRLEKRRMSWDLRLGRATSWCLLIRKQSLHRTL